MRSHLSPAEMRKLTARMYQAEEKIVEEVQDISFQAIFMEDVRDAGRGALCIHQ